MKLSLEIGAERTISKLFIASSLAVDFPPELTATAITIIGAIIVNI